MPPDLPYSLIFMSEVLPTLILTAGGVLALWIGTNAWLRLRKGPHPVELERMAESLELLHHTVEDMRDEMREQLGDVRELSGRIEFAERMLTKARDEGRV